MSQPPQPPPGQPGPSGPPDQPPQDGSYGYPQPAPPPAAPGPPYAQPIPDNPYAQPQPYGGPPQTPGYGYPQAGPPGPQPGPQPGAYGYPPQQPQFPGAPVPPPGPPAPSGGGFLKGRTGALLAAAVAVLLVAGTGGYFALAGSDEPAPKKPEAEQSQDAKPSPSATIDKGDGLGGGGDPAADQDFNAQRKPGEAKVLFTVHAPDVPSDGVYVPRAFTTSNGLIAKAAYKAVVGYDAKTGEKKWGVALPQELCGVTQDSTADDKIVVAHGEKKGGYSTITCDKLMQIDLRTGTVGWKAEVPEEGDFDSLLSAELTYGGGTVTVTRSGFTTAFSVADGKKLWVNEATGECQLKGNAGDRTTLIEVRSCGFDGAREQFSGLDPKTGKKLWSSKKLPKGWTVENVFSTSPLVVHLTHADDKKWNISVFDKGTVRSQVDLKETIEPECTPSLGLDGLQTCTGVVAREDLLFLQTKAEDDRNAIVAIDTRTGKEVRRAQSPEGRTMRPLKIQEDGQLVVYVRAAYRKGGMIGTLGADGTPKKLLQLPAATSEVEKGTYSPLLAFDDGRFVFSPSRLNGSDDARELLMLVYGP